MDFHAIANIFPLMSDQSLRELKEDIRARGVMQPIWVYEDRILDGRNRFLACQALGVTPPMQTYDGTDPVGFVVSLNLKRRHLDESQRAAVAGRIAQLPRGANQHTAIAAPSQAEAAKLLNVSEDSIQRARKVISDGAPELVAAVDAGEVAVSTAAVLTELPKAQQAEVVARGEKEILAKAKEIRAAKTEERRAERIEKIAEISKGNRALFTIERYPIIYADPPWKYEFQESVSREIENHYPTMPLDEICALPVAEIASEAALLFLWATAPKLEEAIKVINSWGFTYRTCLAWVKDKIGTGYWLRGQHELLLIARRGEMPAPAPKDRPASVLIAARTEHSAKPDEVYGIIEKMYPELPRIELFCRKPRNGWAAWGNQV